MMDLDSGHQWTLKLFEGLMELYNGWIDLFAIPRIRGKMSYYFHLLQKLYLRTEVYQIIRDYVFTYHS